MPKIRAALGREAAKAAARLGLDDQAKAFTQTAEQDWRTGAPGGAGGGSTARGGGTLHEALAGQPANAVALTIKRTGKTVEVVSPLQGQLDSAEVGQSFVASVVNGLQWSIHRSTVGFEGFRFGFVAEGAQSGEVHPPFMRAFALGDGDAVRVRVDGVCKFVPGKR